MRWKRCRQMNKELRDWYIQHGICVVCGHEKAVPNRKRCWDCLDKAAEWNANYKANMTEEQKEAAKEKKKQKAEKKIRRAKSSRKMHSLWKEDGGSRKDTMHRMFTKKQKNR